MTPLPPTGEDGAHGTSPPRSIDPNSIPSTPSRAAPARAASSARSARRFATVSRPNPIQLSGFFLKRRKESSPRSFSPPPQHDVHFGEGILNKGKAKKREKRPLTQIEIMAAVEREKQEKKAARKAAKVRHRSRRLPPFFLVSIGTTDPSPPRIFPCGSRLAKLTHLFRRVSSFRRFAGGQEGGSHRTRGVRGERRRRQEADEERAQEARSRRV